MALKSGASQKSKYASNYTPQQGFHRDSLERLQRDRTNPTHLWSKVFAEEFIGTRTAYARMIFIEKTEFDIAHLAVCKPPFLFSFFP
jgi:hypothetical protein